MGHEDVPENMKHYDKSKIRYKESQKGRSLGFCLFLPLASSGLPDRWCVRTVFHDFTLFFGGVIWIQRVADRASER